MMECFFGTARTYEKIDGKLTSVFLADLIIDITKQGLTPEGLLLGSKFLSFGLRSGDRDINRRIGLLREMG